MQCSKNVVNQFTIAAITNYHKLCLQLKATQIYVIPEGSKSEMGLMELTSKAVLLLEAQGENPLLAFSRF